MHDIHFDLQLQCVIEVLSTQHGFLFQKQKKNYLKEGYKISAIQITAYIGLSHCFSEKIAQEYREHMM